MSLSKADRAWTINKKKEKKEKRQHFQLLQFFHNAIGDLSGAKIFHSGGEKLSPESHTFVTFEEEEDI